MIKWNKSIGRFLGETFRKFIQYNEIYLFNSHFIIEPEPKKPEKDEEEQGTKKFITRECCDFTHKGS